MLMVPVKKSYKWANKRARYFLKIDFIRFGIVGTVGFLISEAGIYLIHGKIGWPIIWGFLIGNEAGLISNFVWHENWTYNHLDHKNKPLVEKFWHFHMSSWSGVAIILIIDIMADRVLHTNPYVSQVVGSAIGMFWNFFWTRYYIFRGSSPTVLLNPEETVPEKEISL